jgi:hypothetical protein
MNALLSVTGGTGLKNDYRALDHRRTGLKNYNPDICHRKNRSEE